MEYFTAADDKAEAFSFCRERTQSELTTEVPRLKEMSRELSERLRHFGSTGSRRISLEQETMNHIRVAPDREQTFTTITRQMDMVLERSRGLSR